MLTIALLAIVCMLIACFPAAALILIKKYIWVRIWIAKCDLRPLDFAQKCQKFQKPKFKNFPGGHDLPPLLEICCHFGLTFLGRQISVGLPSWTIGWTEASTPLLLSCCLFQLFFSSIYVTWSNVFKILFIKNRKINTKMLSIKRMNAMKYLITIDIIYIKGYFSAAFV